MKKLFLIAVLSLAMMLLLVACGNGDLSEENGAAADPGESGEEIPYRERMLPLEELVPSERIVLLQNTLNFSREGFYNAGNKPVSEEIDYKGDTVEAYSMSYAVNFLTRGLSAELTVINSDGSTQTIAADDFAGLYVIIDFTSPDPPVLYNPATGTELIDFLFAKTTEGEAIYSIVSDSIHSTAELIAGVDWDAEATYRYVATDKFYIPVGPAENATGDIRGTLSGTINGSFPDLAIASGKINDVIYIEVMEEATE